MATVGVKGLIHWQCILACLSAGNGQAVAYRPDRSLAVRYCLDWDMVMFNFNYFIFCRFISFRTFCWKAARVDSWTELYLAVLMAQRIG